MMEMEPASKTRFNKNPTSQVKLGAKWRPKDRQNRAQAWVVGVIAKNHHAAQ